jgi:predicted nucleic acid-binding protein
MSYLLDTCVISELRKEVPDKVKKWFADKNPHTFQISVVTIAEILDGIERLPASKKKSELEEWFFEGLLDRFQERILPINEEVAKVWGRLSGDLCKRGVPVGVQDLYIAATAKVHSLTVLTINIKHFKNIDVPIINPWA